MTSPQQAMWFASILRFMAVGNFLIEPLGGKSADRGWVWPRLRRSSRQKTASSSYSKNWWASLIFESRSRV